MLRILCVIVVAVCVVALAQAWRDMRHIKNVRDFFLHGERLKLSYFVGTLVATNLSLGNMVFVCAMFGYLFGWSGVFWMVSTIFFLWLGFQIFGPRFRDYVQERGNFGSIHDFLAASHAGNTNSFFKLKQLTAVVSCLSLFVAIIVEAHLATMLLHALSGYPQFFWFITFVLVICMYTSAAGFFSVVFTDMLQCGLMLLATAAGIALLINLPQAKPFAELGYTTDIASILGGIGPLSALGLAVLGFLWMIATPDTWQRNCASRSMTTSLTGTLVGSFIMATLVALFAISGMYVKSAVEPNIPPGLAPQLSQGLFPYTDIFLLDFAAFPGLYSWFGALLAAGLLMAAASTLDTFLIVMAHVINVDLALSSRGMQSLKDTAEVDEPLLLRGRLFIMMTGFAVCVGWLAMNGANLLISPISLFFVVYSLQFTLGIPAIAATYPAFRNATATYYVVASSAVAISILGVWVLANETSEERLLGLTAATWMALLPILPVAIGIAGYAIASVFSTPPLQEMSDEKHPG